jgi:hypothetical protein
MQKQLTGGSHGVKYQKIAFNLIKIKGSLCWPLWAGGGFIF